MQLYSCLRNPLQLLTTIKINSAIELATITQKEKILPSAIAGKELELAITYLCRNETQSKTLFIVRA
jgi:hypothetical protein